MCFLTEEAQQLEPADVLLIAAVLVLVLLVGFCRQVPEMMKLKQVDDSDVDQLLSAEGSLQDQPLRARTHTQVHTESSTDALPPILHTTGPNCLSPAPVPTLGST